MPHKFGNTPDTQCKLSNCDSCITDTGLCKHWVHAQSVRYSSASVWSFAEIDGWFALFDYKREIVLMTKDWNEILQAYRDRPVYVPPPPRVSEPKVDISGIDLSKIKITL